MAETKEQGSEDVGPRPNKEARSSPLGERSPPVLSSVFSPFPRVPPNPRLAGLLPCGVGCKDAEDATAPTPPSAVTSLPARRGPTMWLCAAAGSEHTRVWGGPAGSPAGGGASPGGPRCRWGGRRAPPVPPGLGLCRPQDPRGLAQDLQPRPGISNPPLPPPIRRACRAPWHPSLSGLRQPPGCARGHSA